MDRGRKADATKRGYEYCSMHELLHSYAELVRKTGDPAFADKAEKIFFNAAQGARHPSESCVAYLKSDNSYYMTGGLNGDNSGQESDAVFIFTRASGGNRMSRADGRKDCTILHSIHVDEKWPGSGCVTVRSESCWNLGCRQKVIVDEQTNYPFENTFRFVVTADARFTLKIRKPEWATSVKISAEHTVSDGFIVIDKTWRHRNRWGEPWYQGSGARWHQRGEVLYMGRACAGDTHRRSRRKPSRGPFPDFITWSMLRRNWSCTNTRKPGCDRCQYTHVYHFTL